VTGTATGGVGSSAAAAADLSTLAAAIEPVPRTADAATGSRPDAGRLGKLATWLAAATGRQRGTPLRRMRCVCVGHVPDATLTLADDVHVGVRELIPSASDTALAHGVEAADAEIDGGADLLVVTSGQVAPQVRDAAAALVAVLQGLEPVAVLPRGAGATDTAAWIGRAERVRSLRRRLIAVRSRPDEVLRRLADPSLAALVGVIVRATARRTPLVLGGLPAYSAALVVYHLHPHAADWWQLADSTGEPAGDRVARAFQAAPVLQLDIAAPEGAAGLLAALLVRAATSVMSSVASS
jgi:nicotinate-nucleotide--dimethylbenzimidazole phosphoribosyltransferase